MNHDKANDLLSDWEAALDRWTQYEDDGEEMSTIGSALATFIDELMEGGDDD